MLFFLLLKMFAYLILAFNLYSFTISIVSYIIINNKSTQTLVFTLVLWLTVTATQTLVITIISVGYGASMWNNTGPIQAPRPSPWTGVGRGHMFLFLYPTPHAGLCPAPAPNRLHESWWEKYGARQRNEWGQALHGGRPGN